MTSSAGEGTGKGEGEHPAAPEREHLHALLSELGSGLAVVHTPTQSAVLDPVAARLVGLASERTTIALATLREMIHPADRALMSAHARSFLPRGLNFDITVRVELDGNEDNLRWLRCCGTRFGADEIALLVSDVTAHHELASANAELAEVAARSRIGTFTWDRPAGRITFDAVACVVLGLDVQVLTRDQWRAKWHPDDRDRYDGNPRRYEDFAGGFECRIDVLGTWRWIALDVHEVDDATGRHVGILRDVTQQRLMVQDLAATQATMALAAKATGFGIVTMSLTSRKVFLDEQAARLYGLPPGPTAFDMLTKHVPTADQTAVTQAIMQSLTTGEPFSSSYRWTGKGDEREFELIGAPSPDDPSVLLALLRDVTTARQERAELDASRLRMQLAAEAAGLGIWEIDIETSEVSVDEVAVGILGLTPGTRRVALEELLAQIDPEDAAQLLAAGDNMTADRPNVTEYRMHDGVRWVRNVARIIEIEGVPHSVVGFVQDVTESHHLHEVVAESQQRLSLAAEAAGLGLVDLDVRSGSIYLDGVASRMLELADDAHTRKVNDMRSWLQSNQLVRHSVNPDGTEELTLDAEVPVDGGRSVVLRTHVRRIRNDAGEPVRVIGFVRDITAERLLERERQGLFDALAEREERLQNLADNAPDVLYRIRLVPSFAVEYTSPAIERLTGYTAEEVSEDPTVTVHPEDAKVLLDHWTAGPGPRQPIVIRYRHRDGHITWAEHRITTVMRDGKPYAVEGIARDITTQKNFESQLAFQQLHDTTTGLANRALLVEQLSDRIARIARQGLPVAVVAAHLDRFTYVNDVFGQDAGDEVLRIAAARLDASVRAGDVVGRIGPAEFAAVMEAVDPTTAFERAEEILTRLGEVFPVPGGEAFCTPSVGLSMVEATTIDASSALQDATTALHRALLAGGNRVEVSSDSHREATQRRARIESELRTAIERDQFVLYFQPEVDLSTGKPIGAEALIRWVHPERGLVPPGEFIPLMEELGLIVPVGEWVLAHTHQLGRQWRDRWGEQFVVRCNLSARQLADPRLPDRVAQLTAVGEGDYHPRLCLEITETALVGDIDEAARRLQRLADLGIELAVDDFGTGYSSLTYLKRLPVHIVKIDQSFVRGIVEDAGDRAIVAATISLAKALGREVTAEGIETEAQRWQLVRLGCDRGQGYLFAKPMPIPEFEQWTTERYAATGGGANERRSAPPGFAADHPAH